MRGGDDLVLSGAGAVSALGPNVDAFWEGVRAGRCAVRHVAELSAVGLVPGNAAAVEGYPALPAGAAAGAERASALAEQAAREALASAGLHPGDRAAFGLPARRLAVVVGTTLGGYRFLAAAAEQARPLDPRALLAAGYDGPAVAVARAAGAAGPCLSPSVACCSGVAAVGEAMRLVRSGACDVALAGGVDALSRFVYSGFVSLKALSAGESRPFDRARDGLNLGEGACLVVVERASSARARGVQPLARLLGYGTAGDANHMTGPHPEGEGAARGMAAALADAGLRAEQVDAVNLHGTGTPYNDRMEARAMRAVFGDRAGRVPVNSIKPAIGHTMGAAGAFEALLGALVLRAGEMPPTANTRDVDPDCAPLDVVIERARRLDARTFLTTNSGFGGTNAALVLGRVEPDA